MSLLHARGFTYPISFNSLIHSEPRYFHSHYFQVRKLGLRPGEWWARAHIASKWPNWNLNLDFSNSFHNEYLPHRICFCACKLGVGKRTFLQDGSEDSVKQHIKLLTHSRLWLTITSYSPCGSKSGQWFPYGLDSIGPSHNGTPTARYPRVIQVATNDLEEMSAGTCLVLVPISQSVFYLLFTSPRRVATSDNSEPGRVNQLSLSHRGHR